MCKQLGGKFLEPLSIFLLLYPNVPLQKTTTNRVTETEIVCLMNTNAFVLFPATRRQTTAGDYLGQQKPTLPYRLTGQL